MTQAPLFTIIYGPTSSGKTEQAIDRARKTQANLLSFDSRHVYKDMDIVTGKDRPDPMESFQMFGLDLVSPSEAFSVHHFYEYAKPIITQHRDEQKPLILVGGSWQYAGVLLHPPESLLSERTPAERKIWEKLSTEELQSLVQKTNTDRWQRMNESDRANPRRLVRALEHTSSVRVEVPPLLESSEIHLDILNPDMEILEQRIRTRIERRLDQGAVQETQHLLKKYTDWSLPAFSSTGYGILRQHIEGLVSLEEAKKLWYFQERQYVKRQKTWIKKISASKIP